MKTRDRMPGAFARGLALPLALGLAAATAGCASDPYADSAPRTAAESEMPPPEGAAAALLRVARATRAAGDYESSINVLKRAHDLKPYDADIAIELGESLAAVGAYNESREMMVKALILTPRDTRAVRGLANVLLALSEPALAIGRYREALAIQPEAATYSGLGVALDATGKPAEAQKSYRRGLELAPRNPRLIGNLALSLALDSKTDDAIELLAGELRDGRTGPRLRQNLALIYGLAGRDRDARALLRLDLDEAAVRNNVAYYEMLRGLPAKHRRDTVLGARQLARGDDEAAAAK